MDAGRFGPTVVVTSPDGSRATVALQGGHVLSWSAPDGTERLFLSSLARNHDDHGAPMAVRGGIPVCFPQFADLGPLPKHGFARLSNWVYEHGAFTLRVAPHDWPGWPHTCTLQLTVQPSAERLALDLTVTNRGSEAFSFTGALHTYLAVADVIDVELEGLEGCSFVDPGNHTGVVEGSLSFGVEVDRKVLAVPRGHIVLLHGGTPGVHGIAQHGFADAVVWNIGPERAATLSDLGLGEWPHYLCVEAAQVGAPVVLPPGATWSGGQTLHATWRS